MTYSNVTDIVRELARPIVENMGLELVDVEYFREGPNWYLKVYIDKEGGVTLNDCELVNKPLGEKLDEIDPIAQSYIFEVSSPGVERAFKTVRDYEKAIGHTVQIKLYKSIDGCKTVKGVLDAFDEETVTVVTDDNDKKTYPLEVISKINRVILI